MQTAIRWAFCILGIEVLFLLGLQADLLAVVPVLSASCILLSANPKGLFAKPRTVIIAYVLIGHLGLLNSVFWGNDLFCIFVMTLVAVGLMAAIPCIHPPAVALLFVLANSAHPFQAYLLTVGLVGGLLLMHFVSQWVVDQLYKIGETDSILLPENNSSRFSTIFSAVKNG